MGYKNEKFSEVSLHSLKLPKFSESTKTRIGVAIKILKVPIFITFRSTIRKKSK